jgi:hypothetical protein
VEDYGYTPNDYISCLKCKKDDGGAEFAKLVISTCPTKELANRNGVLVCAAGADRASKPTARKAAAAAPAPPTLAAATQPPAAVPITGNDGVSP